MNTVFLITVKILLIIASKLRLTYNEVNILIWYIILPVLWGALLSILLHTAILFIIVALYAIVLGCNLRKCSDKLFQKSVQFLQQFNKIGLNYTQASVIVCLVLPFAVTFALTMIFI